MPGPPAARLPAYATIGAVIMAPWLLAGGEDWAAPLVTLPVLVGGGVWCLLALRRVGPLPLELRLAAAAAALLLGFLVFQVIPLTDSLLRAISPGAARIQLAARNVLLGVYGRGIVLPRVSLAPCDTMRVIASFLAGWICFNVGLEMRCSTALMLRILRLMLFSSVLLVLVALVQLLGESDRIFWLYAPRLGGNVMGAFTNRNHFASYVNMALGVGLGLLGMSRLRRNGKTATHTGGRLAWPPAAFLAVAVLIVGTSASLSRGGLMGLATCAAIFWILAPRGARPRRLAGPAVLLGLALGVWIAGGRMVERFVWLHERVSDIDGMIRLAAVRDAWRLFSAFAVTGCGGGAFQHTFPRFASASVVIGRWTHLHNDFVEWLCEGGLAGLVLSGGIAVGLGTLAARGWRGLMLGERWLAAGMAGALAGLAAHSVVDYNLHRMTHWLLASLLLGMLTGLLLRA
ncbi:MAG TPA: O-antigen ligase domain-containing protein, partial [Kiritimatiellae bacterium]|nr:O-antigen ligase domain-containing protein [Kiritimatiellia bacterium]